MFVINVCHSIAGQVPAPGYHPEGMYEFKIDLDGDAVEEVTYRLTFDERDAAGKQRFVLRCIRGAEAVDPNAAGTLLAQGTTGESVTTAGGVRIWAGKAGDPFWIEPDVLHAVGHAFQDGTTIDLGGWMRERRRTSSPITPSTLSCSKCPMVNSWLGPATSGGMSLGRGDASHRRRGWRSINRVGLR